MAAFITSGFTMDARNKQARVLMAERADFLGAVRLPTGAHRRAAGTDALTDVLILRVREEGQEPTSTAWTSTTPHTVDGQEIRINEYFAAHPEHVLGTLAVGHGLHGAATTLVHAQPGIDLGPQLRAALTQITTAARATGLTYSTAPALEPVEISSEREHAQLVRWHGALNVDADGNLAKYLHGTLEPLDVTPGVAAELRSLVKLRDATTALLTLEAKTVGNDHPVVEAQRRTLGDLFDAHTARYGCPSRVTISERVNPRDPDEPIISRRVSKATQIFRSDPHAQTVFALAIWDPHTDTFAKAGILKGRVIQERIRPQGADSASDAIALSLDATGRIDLSYIADLLDVDENQALNEIGDLAYTDPATGELESASAYLSGNVRIKLEAAREAAATDPAFARNVDALTRVQPVPLAAGEIEAKIGAVWIPDSDIQAFTQQLLGDRSATVKTAGAGKWEVRLSKASRQSVLARQIWGTPDIHAGAIIEKIATQSQIKVNTTIDEKSVLDPERTAIALGKADEIRERFAEWVWENPQRAARLQKAYNDTFNSVVLRTYDQEAAGLTLPGLARTFNPRDHQRVAVARMLHEPTVGLFHEVGAGKTAEMVMGAMELRRLGMAKKPVIVVPNHMLEQFSREWLGIYPAARILAASTETLKTRDDRRAFVAATALNDWDGIIMTQSAFQRISLSPEFEERYLDRELDVQRRVIEAQRESGMGTEASVKQAEKALAQREEDMRKRLDALDRDPGLMFEQTGIDYLIVDEAHMFKNLATASGITGAAIRGAQRATDLHMKTEWLRQSRGDKVATFATGTPVSNSITETHVMQRYLRPDLLTDAGIDTFDQWVATFGSVVTEMEIAPQGGYKLKARLSSFQNVPELLTMWSTFADTKTADDLNLERPELAMNRDGERQPATVVVPTSRELHNYMVDLAHRVEAIEARQVEMTEDNMLKVSTDGRKAACDMRMVGQTAAGPTKADYVVDQVARIWRATKDNTYINSDTKETSPIHGATQLIFCDYSTPNGTGWNMYDEIRDGLIESGMDRGEIAFIHDANTDAKKAAMFAAVREGRIKVLLGSTSKMGTGTNVQDRIVALHHVDCPWRPADLTQRDGRAIRQGNQNPEVAIYRYVTSRSFDAFMWQTVERKARMIHQLMQGRLDVREIEDLGDATLSAGAAKAAASGDPLILELAQTQALVTKLGRLERAHARTENGLKATIADAHSRVRVIDQEIPALTRAVDNTIPTAGKDFAITIAGTRFIERVPAQNHLHAIVAEAYARHADSLKYAHRPHIALPGTIELGGHSMNAKMYRDFDKVWLRFTLTNFPHISVELERTELEVDKHFTIARLERMTASLPERLASLHRERDAALREADNAQPRIGQPFKHADTLVAARQRLADINKTMSKAAENAAASPQNPAPAYADATAGHISR